MNFFFFSGLNVYYKMDRHIPYNITHSNVFTANPFKIKKSYKLIKVIDNLFVSINKFENANTKYDEISIKIKSCVT